MEAIRQLLLGARCFGFNSGIQHGLFLPGFFFKDELIVQLRRLS
jgi:hypothetical protein